ncbi:MAG: radical SAM protein [Lachnospiraceae bacterium]
MEFIPARKILHKVRHDTGQWFGIDYNINLYKGCSHGCIYCDSRSDCYRIENFDTVRSKQDAIPLLERDLKSCRGSGVVGIGAMSDAYNPQEKKYEITGQALQLLLEYGYGAALATKSALVARDAELLGRIAAKQSCLVKFTVTAAEDTLSRQLEPGTSVSSRRFAAMEQVAASGVFTGVLLTPVLPFITDNEENLLGIVRQAKAHGAGFVYTSMGVTLRQNQRDYYYQQLNAHFPGLWQRYNETYGSAYSCQVPDSRQLYRIFAQECERLGLLYKMQDIIAAYKRPDSYEQMSLFE